MPDIYSLGLGGGSRVRFHANNKVTIGPDSVGNNIEREAIVFGGSTLTATDIAVAAGLALDVGNASLVQNVLSPEQLSLALAEISRILESATDRMKTDPQDIAVLLVGGGSIIVPPSLKGVKEVIKSPNFSVANAVGASIGRISGEIDRVEILEGRKHEEVVEACKSDAIAKAIGAGAAPDSVTIADVAMIQLPVSDLIPTLILYRHWFEYSSMSRTKQQGLSSRQLES